jgi:flagellin-like protein
MRRRFLFPDKRGVSEIIASLILILIVSVAGVVAYSISLSAFSSSSGSFQLQTIQREERTRERFAIIAVWWNTTNQLNLTILNYGRIELAVDVVYVDGTPASSYLSGKGVKTGTWNLTNVRFISSVPIQSGQTYGIAAVSERGSKNEIFWKA